jgi:hypothetical protein
MKRMTQITSLVTLLGATTAACSSSHQPTREEYDDTAQAIASTTATGGGGGDVASMSDSVTIALGTMPAGFSLSGSGQFRGSRLGVDYSYSIACENLAGAPLTLCDRTTNEATVDVAWSGNLDTQYVDASVTRSGTWTVTGLQTDTATFAGDSTFSFDATVHSIFRPGVTATYAFDASASYDAVRISTQQRQVVDGSASFDISARHTVTGGRNDVDASFDVRAEITFHAGTADLVLDGTQRYTINLASGLVVRVN